MIKIDKKRALLLHKRISVLTGGDPSVRDEALLESALESAYQTFSGDELYPTLEEKGARIGYSLIANHAFTDGNKRIGMLALMTFLAVNGAPITPAVSEVARVGLAVASGRMDYGALLAWVKKNRTHELSSSCTNYKK